jgi:trigger factor
VVIGAGRFIPGFEEQLIGVKTGQETEINVTFPADYGAAHLAGKAAVFEIKVREVRKPVEPTLDDDFAKGLGLESLEKLNEIVRQQLEGEHARASRLKAKRSLLDALDTAHNFELPGRMVEAEFDQIWSQLEQEKAAGRLDAEDAAKDEEQLRADYQRISQRRVRLGLVLAEIGQRAGVQITDEETQRAMIAEARQYPGQERQVLQYFQKNPGALAQLRAPIYEDKVVDLLLTRVQLIEQTVDRETLLSDDDME